MKQILKPRWVIFNHSDVPQGQTIAWTRKRCKQLLFDDNKHMADEKYRTWDFWKKNGWSCKKVQITFETI